MELAPEFEATTRLQFFKDQLVQEYPECIEDLNEQYVTFEFIMSEDRNKQISWDPREITEFEAEFQILMYEICEESNAAQMRVMLLGN